MKILLSIVLLMIVAALVWYAGLVGCRNPSTGGVVRWWQSELIIDGVCWCSPLAGLECDSFRDHSISRFP